ncbi:MAG: RNA polymerase sigma factor [Deltaproteobacteria bacterium]|nr:RNA polymerase sigma factor [Deltaproteobacteria bacterium]
MLEPVTDELARALRAAWFRYVDTLEPFRPNLHAYCLRMCGNVWDAEDLAQETLLRGFAAIGRGDLHGEHSRVANPRAYLLRVATNLWIDAARRRSHESHDAPESIAAEVSAPLAAREAGELLFERASPQERAAIVLAEGFELSHAEIADVLSTTVGAVKAALHRGRARLHAEPDRVHHGRPSRELVDRFVAAFNARDVARVTAILLETVTIEVMGVGGGRRNDGVWVASSLAESAVRAEAREFRGEWLVASVRDGDWLCGITRFEEVDGRVSRIRSYGYCPETLAHVAAALGLASRTRHYHQPPQILEGMIASTTLPWGVRHDTRSV